MSETTVPFGEDGDRCGEFWPNRDEPCDCPDCNPPEISRLREYATDIIVAAFHSLCFAALFAVVSWGLYLPGWINADVFVEMLRYALGFSAGAVLSTPLYMAFLLLRDRLCGTGARR